MSRVEQLPSVVISRDGFPSPPRREARITTPEDREFFETFLGALAEHGLESEDLVYSGFDGTTVNNPSAQKQRVWVMDQKFWRWALKSTATATAINYAERYEVPCIGVYDLNQLWVSEEGETSQALSEARASSPEGIFHKVTHIDFPRALPATALRGLVFFEYGV